MSPRSTYLRVQADKCRSHTLSMSMGDVVTQAALRKLADEYIAQAEEIESKENSAAIDDGTSAQRGLVGALELGERSVLRLIAPTPDDAALMILQRYCT
jgi:hypothetical protein